MVYQQHKYCSTSWGSLLQNQFKLRPTKPSSDIEPLYGQFMTDLRHKGFQGEISQSYSQRLLASIDNSVYQVLPQGVLFARHEADIQLVLQLCAKDKYRGISLTAKGGGTGTNGQSLNTGLVLDLSRHMNRILDVNLAEGFVEVEPGVVLDQLNQELKPSGVFFAPNLSPSSRATIGGMCNTDACGKGSRVYGRTSDHIEELDCTLIGGDQLRLGRNLDAARTQGTAREQQRLESIEALLKSILQENKTEIAGLYPDMARFLTGYNLSKLEDKSAPLSLTYLISGSEGTLAVVTKLKLRITPIPQHTELILVSYPQFNQALSQAQDLLSFDPHAIETIDQTILNLAREDIIWHRVAKMFASPPNEVSAINILEFSSQDEYQLDEKTKQIKDHLRQNGYSFYASRSTEERIAIWDLRKKGVGLLGNLAGHRRPIPFVEDTAVPPALLAAYIKDFREILDGYGLRYGMFGHVDVGCLHVRPALDLRDPEDEALFRKISDKVKDLVKKYHGIMWAEHGRGFRSEYTKEFFGPNLFEKLREIKAAFDPHNQLNPGKIVSPKGFDEVPELDQVALRAHRDRSIDRAVAESFKQAIHCNGNGACFHFDPDHVMCPSHKVTRDRVHSPKGRATLIREWLRQLNFQSYDASRSAKGIGWLPKRANKDFSHEVYEAMKGCLSCKACTSQCPIKVDIPELKSKFLEHYHSRYFRPLTDYMIAFGEDLHRTLQPVSLLYNAVVQRPFAQVLLRHLFGMIHPPLLSYPGPVKRLWTRGVPILSPTKPQVPANDRSVIIVQDAMTSLYEAEVLSDVVDLIKYCGFDPYVAPLYSNGKGYHVKGFRRLFKARALKNLEMLENLAKAGAPLVGIDPAMTLTYREEYPELLGRSTKVYMLHEWMAERCEQLKPPPVKEVKKFTLLAHCQEQTSGAASLDAWTQIFQKFGHHLKVKATGCCGMAGAYGHEADNFESSRGIFEMSWLRHIRQAEKDEHILIATGASCRTQAKRLQAIKMLHPASALLQSLL